MQLQRNLNYYSIMLTTAAAEQADVICDLQLSTKSVKQNDANVLAGPV